ncbi:hypothetical protein NMG60_11031271 [Bertholletia excelsa]
MGRAPCCDKANVKKGPWSPEEDAKLKSYIEQHGTGGNWIALPQKIGLKRCGKSCRLRWLNYLRPNIKHGGFSEEEDNIICSLYISIGSRWSIIATQLPGRTDNDIKNYWNTRLKKKLLGKQRKSHQQSRRSNNSSLKQGLRKQNDQRPPVVSSTININEAPSWPDVPILAPVLPNYSNQEPSFNDHASIRKLLIKLGGKFSEDDNYVPSINSTFSFIEQPYVPSIGHMLSSTSTSHDALNPQLVTNNYGIEGSNFPNLAGQGTFGADLEKFVYENPKRSLDGLEFFYGEMISTNATTEPTSGESMEWCEMSSLSYNPPVVSNCDGPYQPGMIQECAFDGYNAFSTL